MTVLLYSMPAAKSRLKNPLCPCICLVYSAAAATASVELACHTKCTKLCRLDTMLLNPF